MRRFMTMIGLVTAVIIIGCNKRLESQNSGGQTQLDTTIIAQGLEVPWEILWSPDNHIWVTERTGRVLRINPDNKQKQLLLDIDVAQEGESGLLGMALHPDFPGTPWVYLVYNYYESTNIKERLSKFIYQEEQLINEEILINNIPGNTYHDGSRLAFGPDGKLYMTTGDAGNMPWAQDPNSLNGKVLRINPDGTVPEDNPTAGSYVWTLGSRNAQGLDFSPAGILYSSEHGPDSDDEINIIEMGRNYGWPNVKGMCNTPEEIIFCDENNVREPIQTYTPTLALAGIAYYGHNLIPEWNNSLIVTSLKAGKMLILHLDEAGMTITGSTTVYDNTLGRLRDVCISGDGRVFISTSNRDGRGTPKPGDDKIIEIKPQDPNSIDKKDKSSGLRIVPNPVKGLFSVIMDSSFNNGTFSLFDVHGKLHMQGNSNTLVSGIDISRLLPGLYKIVLKNERNSASASVLKM